MKLCHILGGKLLKYITQRSLRKANELIFVRCASASSALKRFVVRKISDNIILNTEMEKIFNMLIL